MSNPALSLRSDSLSSPLVFVDTAEGALTVEGDVTVAAGAVFRGQLTARRITILGTFEGVVTARDGLHLGPAAVLSGEARATRLTLDPGASLQAMVRAGGPAETPVTNVDPMPAAAVLSSVYAESSGREQGAPRSPLPAMPAVETACMADVEQTLKGFEVKLAQLAARAR